MICQIYVILTPRSLTVRRDLSFYGNTEEDSASCDNSPPSLSALRHSLHEHYRAFICSVVRRTSRALLNIVMYVSEQ